jgi:hypothetical protein
LIDDDVGVENKKNEKKKIKRMTKCGKKSERSISRKSAVVVQDRGAISSVYNA